MTFEMYYLNETREDRIHILLAIAAALREIGIGFASSHLPEDVLEKIIDSEHTYLVIGALPEGK